MKKLIIVAIALLAALVFVGRRVDFSTIYVNGLGGSMNDQIGYISVARNLVDFGTMKTSVVFPSTLAQNTRKNYFYMPGQYLALAAAFRLFGYHVWSALLPALVGFVLSALLVFWIGSRMYGPWAGCAAAILFVIFPPNVMFAFSAMSEVTLSAAVLVALAIFLVLPDGVSSRAKSRDPLRPGDASTALGMTLQPILGPLLVMLPFLFRETGAIIAVPMCLMIWQRSRWRSAALFAVLTLVLMFAVMKSPIAGGRPNLFVNNLVTPSTVRTIYLDAYAVESVDRSPRSLARMMRVKLDQNARLLMAPFLPKSAQNDSEPGELLAVTFILAGVPFAILVAIWRKDAFAAGVAIVVLVLLALILLTYTVWAHRGMRVLMLAQPLVSLVYGAIIGHLIERRRWIVCAFIAVIIGFLLARGARYVDYNYDPQAQRNAKDLADARFVETLGHDDRKLLVSPHYYVVRYMLDHHPVQWSFVPADLRTFRLLQAKYDIGTIIYPRSSGGWDRPSVEELATLGFRVVRTTTHDDQEILILRR